MEGVRVVWSLPLVDLGADRLTDRAVILASLLAVKVSVRTVLVAVRPIS